MSMQITLLRYILLLEVVGVMIRVLMAELGVWLRVRH